MSSEDGRDIDASFLRKRQGDARQPFVEVSDDGFRFLVAYVLRLSALYRSCCSPVGTYLSKEPGDEVSKDDCLVCLVVTGRRRNGGEIPQIRFPLIQVSIRGLGVDQDDPWSSFNQPAPVKYTDTAISHGLDGSGQLWDSWLELLDFDSSLLKSAKKRNP